MKLSTVFTAGATFFQGLAEACAATSIVLDDSPYPPDSSEEPPPATSREPNGVDLTGLATLGDEALDMMASAEPPRSEPEAEPLAGSVGARKRR